MVFVSDLSYSINMDTNSQASSTSKMQSVNQAYDFMLPGFKESDLILPDNYQCDFMRPDYLDSNYIRPDYLEYDHMFPDYQVSDFNKFLLELTGVSSEIQKYLFHGKTNLAETDDELDFLTRGIHANVEHDGPCSGKTCDKCFQCGRYTSQCIYCKWVYNRYECPNSECIMNTYKPFDTSEFEDTKDPLDFG